MTPTEAQITAGREAAHALKDSGKEGSFTANPDPYIKAIYEAMTTEALMPALRIEARPSKQRTRKQA